MLRRQLVTGLVMTITMTVLVGLIYPLVMTGFAQVAFHGRANGSLVKNNGKVVGSSLIGQNFSDANGNALTQYFQPRPSAAGTDGYDATASGGSNLGPSNPKLIGNVPGVNITTKTNPYATPTDPFCVPVQQTDQKGNPVAGKQGNPVYQKDNSGNFVCNPNTVFERALAYRQLNGLAADAKVPVDAVTASASGLDPDISVANAQLQAARVADARHLALARVNALIANHTNARQWGVLGERTVNVLNLNLALDRLS